MKPLTFGQTIELSTFFIGGRKDRINSLGTVLNLSKNHDPTKDPEVILALKRMHRKIGRAQEQATPLTKGLLCQLLNNCDNSSIMGIRNQVLL